MWQRNITRQWDSGPAGGESIAEVVTRVHEGVIVLINQSAAEHTLLVGHGFVAKTIRALVNRDFSDFFDWQLGNGHWLVLEHVERVADYRVPVASPLPGA